MFLFSKPGVLSTMTVYTAELLLNVAASEGWVTTCLRGSWGFNGIVMMWKRKLNRVWCVLLACGS